MKFLRLPEVKSVVGMSRSQIYRLIKTNDFPKPVKLSTRMAVWPDTDIRAWQEKKLEAVSNPS